MGMSDHHPPHFYLDDTWYILTAATYDHAPFLACEEAKALVRDSLKRLVSRFNLALRAWVILGNHYHLLLKTNEGKGLTRFVGELHGSTSRQLNLREGVLGRQVWHNYWDTCIRSEVDLWTRFNYVHYNPVKHGYVERPDQWEFSSYAYYLRTKGEEWLLDCSQRYPVVDFLRGDDFTG